MSEKEQASEKMHNDRIKADSPKAMSLDDSLARDLQFDQQKIEYRMGDDISQGKQSKQLYEGGSGESAGQEFEAQDKELSMSFEDDREEVKISF